MYRTRLVPLEGTTTETGPFLNKATDTGRDDARTPDAGSIKTSALYDTGTIKTFTGVPDTGTPNLLARTRYPGYVHCGTGLQIFWVAWPLIQLLICAFVYPVNDIAHVILLVKLHNIPHFSTLAFWVILNTSKKQMCHSLLGGYLRTSSHYRLLI